MISAFANDNAHNIARQNDYCNHFSEFMLLILSHPSHEVRKKNFIFH